MPSHKIIKWIIACTILFSGFFLYWFSLPSPLFNDPVSTVINAENNQLLGAMIAEDGQWRFPYNDHIPVKFEKAILLFEDKNFYRHPGVNPLSLCRALYTNYKNKKIISGGSTITMQLIRLSRKGKPRNIWQKLIEIILATRTEIRFSKKEILSMFASYAPFGSNIVGLDAAAWRYFGRNPDHLSWAETATLAVLPNAPSLIYPGKNHELLMKKRNRLLDKLYVTGIIDKTDWQLAKSEPLPSAPNDIPSYAPHLLSRLYLSEFKNKQVHTTILLPLQVKVNDIVERHVEKLRFNKIYNAAVIVAEVETGNVIAYVGNSKQFEDEDHGNAVDIITSPRSTGSILKPILYAAMLQAGEILPGTLIPDVPVMFAGYSPKNFSNTYDGVVHAQRALSKSLNIPAVFLLKEYGIDRFYDLLKKTGITTLNRPPSDYGLSLILGGAEGKLWDITGVFASMARTLKHFDDYAGRYGKDDFHELNLLQDNKKFSNQKPEYQQATVLNAASVWLTFKALLDVNKPEEESGWEYFLSSRNIAWKTGTSFGFRDGWAVGITKNYVVGVWTGNADGEGRPGLTGVTCAAPILFDVFRELPRDNWFFQPYTEMTQIPVCRLSGHRATELCQPVDTVWIQDAGLRTLPCSNHKLIHLDKTGKYRVTSECESTFNMKHISWFILPPLQEWYYKFKDPSYRSLPPYRADCRPKESKIMEFIYPHDETGIYIPVDIDNKIGQTVFEVAHRNPGITIYWHLDGFYLGSTKNIHQMALSPQKGKHTIVLVDEEGNTISKQFEIINQQR